MRAKFFAVWLFWVVASLVPFVIIDGWSIRVIIASAVFMVHALLPASFVFTSRKVRWQVVEPPLLVDRRCAVASDLDVVELGRAGYDTFDTG